MKSHDPRYFLYILINRGLGLAGDLIGSGFRCDPESLVGLEHSLRCWSCETCSCVTMQDSIQVDLKVWFNEKRCISGPIRLSDGMFVLFYLADAIRAINEISRSTLSFQTHL